MKSIKLVKSDCSTSEFLVCKKLLEDNGYELTFLQTPNHSYIYGVYVYKRGLFFDFYTSISDACKELL